MTNTRKRKKISNGYIWSDNLKRWRRLPRSIWLKIQQLQKHPYRHSHQHPDLLNRSSNTISEPAP